MSLGPLLVMGLLLGKAAAPDVAPSEQDVPSTASASKSPQQPHAQEGPGQRVSLATEAFSRMEPEGPFSVWDITGRVTWTPDLQGLRRVIVYHSIRATDSAGTHMLLQVELTHPLASIARRLTGAKLRQGTNDSWLLIWQAPDSSGEVLRLLLQGTVELHRLQNSPHKLMLLGGEEGMEQLAVFDNIMLR
ncbi:MAG TPA: hypothetical protein VFZ09_42785 [Archangium sp.]|uniref:hypothetical protein n=1 Tax=Archangium sp. TaxID=1872627 RepID=UPI002E2F1CB5|nr:hypothetical protein [Archangium sp.]HEX5753005.1 hypothetical protein [Archangium sp.]